MFNPKKYAALLGQMESNNNYNEINSLGALGRYQFMPSTLTSLKNNYSLPDWKNSAYFLSNPYLQETYLLALIKDTEQFIINERLDRFIGKKIQGSKRFPYTIAKLNLYGMLAAAHLSGVGNLKRFLLEGHDPNDGMTSLADYAAYFSSKLTDNDFFFTIALALIPAIALYYYK